MFTRASSDCAPWPRRCGVELNKSTRVVLTDWSQAELTEKQVLYAALDSIASRWTCVELVRLGAFAHNSQAVVRAKIQKLMENGNSARHTRYARMLSKESDKLHEFFEGLFAKCVAWRPAQRRPWSTGRAYCPLVTPCGATLRHTITLQSRQHPKSLEYEARVVLSWPTRKFRSIDGPASEARRTFLIRTAKDRISLRAISKAGFQVRDALNILQRLSNHDVSGDGGWTEDDIHDLEDREDYPELADGADDLQEDPELD